MLTDRLGRVDEIVGLFFPNRGGLVTSFALRWASPGLCPLSRC